MEGIIYKYTAPNGKVYIGQTLNENARRQNFLNENNKYAGRKINNARKKYGPENFKYEVLERKNYSSTEEATTDLDTLEIYYINVYNSYYEGYNSTKGGNTEFRVCLQDEELKKMLSEKMKNYYMTHDSPFKGKHHTEENRKKISELAKQRIGSKNPFYGKKCSQATKDALTKANGKAVVQIDKDTNEILNEFGSAQLAAIFLGKKTNANGTILDACRDFPRKGHRKVYTVYGYKWRLKKDIEGSTTIGIDGKKYYVPSTSTLQANGNGSGEHSNKKE